MRPFRLALLLGSTTLLSLAACGDGAPDPTDTADAMAAPGGDLVGSWRALTVVGNQPIDERDIYTFADDGTYSRVEPDETVTGTYRAENGRLFLHDSGPADSGYELGYLADDERFLFGLFDPDDDGADAVATWTGTALYSGDPWVTTYELRADGTAHLREEYSGNIDDMDGTWTQVGDDVTVSYRPDESTTINSLNTMYDGHLGTLFERIE